jgi:hypothetical protein
MNADAWNLLAERSRALVHHASSLMGTLTHPTLVVDDGMRLAIAARTAIAVEGLLAALAAAPELAAHLRTVQRFESSLAGWQRSVGEANPLERRYQTALLQQAAQVLISCLHVETLALGECARVDVATLDVLARSGHGSA